jgi:hypothetical protein
MTALKFTEFPEHVSKDNDDMHSCLCETVGINVSYANCTRREILTNYALYRLASPDDDILLNEIKISNIIDRKKIALRAMDVVLFGAPRSK